jgi:hypothetical protein
MKKTLIATLTLALASALFAAPQSDPPKESTAKAQKAKKPKKKKKESQSEEKK